jgi:hypothetical protein
MAVHRLRALGFTQGKTAIERLLLNARTAIERDVLEALDRAWKRRCSDDEGERLELAAQILTRSREGRRRRVRPVPNWVAKLLLKPHLAAELPPNLHLRRWAAVHKAHWIDKLSWPKAREAAAKDDPEKTPRTMKESYGLIVNLGK